MTTKKKLQSRMMRMESTSKAMAFLDEVIGEPMTFADTLKTIRKTDELTQGQVAELIGVTRSHICDIEKGRKMVSPERAARFAKVLGYSPEQFVRLALQDQIRSAGLDMEVKIEAA